MPESGALLPPTEMFQSAFGSHQVNFLSNIFSVQSPVRKKMGYGRADIVVTSWAFIFNFDMSGFIGRKTVKDCLSRQQPDGGITEVLNSIS